jgi:hypothetical protein
MNRSTLVGAGLSTAGIVGYAAGIYVAYPGRGFTITAVMIGIALLAMGHRTPSGRPA